MKRKKTNKFLCSKNDKIARERIHILKVLQTKQIKTLIFNNNSKCMHNGYYVPGTSLNTLPILTNLNL